jgi:hypothetical protein
MKMYEQFGVDCNSTVFKSGFFYNGNCDLNEMKAGESFINKGAIIEIFHPKRTISRS